jgi:5'-methylthioadenosine phosphorylase
MPAAHPASPEARSKIVLGVVGGSGLYAMEGLANVREVAVETPFGAPSAPYTVGELPREGRAPLQCVFLPRHGHGHVLLPTEVNYRANVHGFKQLGVTHLLSVSAVGSLAEDVAPGHLVVPDQLLDRTKGQRDATFFGGGCVAHVQFGEPTDAAFRKLVLDAARGEATTVHDGGTLVVMEGPAFSTKAESHDYRRRGARIIGMTALPEAKLAREAEIAYAILALSTDYDCWHESEEEVTVDAVMAVMKRNVEMAKSVVRRVASTLPEASAALPPPRAIEHALITAQDKIPAVTRQRLDLIIGHYLQRRG